jgi:hypothetical protein
MEEKHITQAELARRWRISPRTLERWRARGTGPAYLKIGGRVVYRQIDVAAFENRRRETGEGIVVAAPKPQKSLRARSGV